MRTPSSVAVKSAPAPCLVVPVHCQATLSSPVPSDDDGTLAQQRENARVKRAQHQGVRGPELGDECVRFGSGPLDQLSHLLTSFIFAPDTTQAPWGLDVSAPHAAQSGIVRLKPDPVAVEGTPRKLVSVRQLSRQVAQREPAEASEASSEFRAPTMQVGVRESDHLRVPYNRFLFATSGIASLLGGVFGASPLLAVLGGAVFFTNVAINVGLSGEMHWTRQLPAADVEQLLLTEAHWRQRLARRIGAWPASPSWLVPPVPLDGSAAGLLAPGDSHTLFEQTSFGWNVSAIVPFVLRGGWQQASAGSNALGIERHDEHSMLLWLRLDESLRSGSWLRAGPLWSSGHVGDGDRQAHTASVLVPWPSAQASLLWQCFGDAYARAVRRRRAWPLPQVVLPIAYAMAGPLHRAHLCPTRWLEACRPVTDLPAHVLAHPLEQERESVHSHGHSAHWSWLQTAIDGHVAQRGAMWWGDPQRALSQREQSFVVRGLEESLRDGYRFVWKFSLFWPAGTPQSPDRPPRVATFTAVLSRTTERNLAPFADRINEATGDLWHADSLPARQAVDERGSLGSDESSETSSQSVHFESFPRQWAQAIEDPQERTALLHAPMPARPKPAPQTNLFVEISRPYAWNKPPARGRETLRAALKTLEAGTEPGAGHALEEALSQAGLRAFAELDQILGAHAQPALARITSASYLALELRAQTERMQAACAQARGTSAAPETQPAADASLVADLAAHVAFWRRCQAWPLPLPLARAAGKRGKHLEALRRVVAPKEVDPFARSRRRSRTETRPTVLSAPEPSLLG